MEKSIRSLGCFQLIRPRKSTALVFVCVWACFALPILGSAANLTSEIEETATAPVNNSDSEVQEGRTATLSVPDPELKYEFADTDEALEELSEGPHIHSAFDNSFSDLLEYGDSEAGHYHVHVVQASPSALQRRGLKLSLDADGHLVEGAAMGGTAGRGDVCISAPDVLSLEDASLLKASLGSMTAPVAGNPIPLFSRGKLETFVTQLEDGSFKCLEGGTQNINRKMFSPHLFLTSAVSCLRQASPLLCISDGPHVVELELLRATSHFFVGR